MTRPSSILSLLAARQSTAAAAASTSLSSLFGNRSFSTSFYATEQQSATPASRTPIGKIERRLQITFTCTAAVPTLSSTSNSVEAKAGNDQTTTLCHHRSTHEFSRRSYEHGIVLVECPSCKNRHLIGEAKRSLQLNTQANLDLLQPTTCRGSHRHPHRLIPKACHSMDPSNPERSNSL